MTTRGDQDSDRTVQATPEVSADPDATVVDDAQGQAVANGNGGCPSIPGYRVSERIGVGGMGVVWKAEQVSTRREVALKLLDARGADSEEMLGRFEREVELAARLEHPHITRVYDSGLHTGGCYYAMEFVDGVPLDEYVREQGLAPADVLALMGKVCAAVQYAHQNGVIHRDLKPDNILVDDEGNPHILDFGLAEVMDEQRQTMMLSMEGDLLGTPAFMAYVPRGL
jgi:serine/threonine protein kinase